MEMVRDVDGEDGNGERCGWRGENGGMSTRTIRHTKGTTESWNRIIILRGWTMYKDERHVDGCELIELVRQGLNG